MTRINSGVDVHPSVHLHPSLRSAGYRDRDPLAVTYPQQEGGGVEEWKYPLGSTVHPSTFPGKEYRSFLAGVETASRGLVRVPALHIVQGHFLGSGGHGRRSGRLAQGPIVQPPCKAARRCRAGGWFQAERRIEEPSPQAGEVLQSQRFSHLRVLSVAIPWPLSPKEGTR